MARARRKTPPMRKPEALAYLLGALALFACSLAAGAPQQTFEVQPESQYLVQNGHDARLRCLVRNRQGECLWLRNGRAVGVIAKKYQFNRQPEDGDCSLMIRNVSVAQDDGLWQCQVTASDVEQDTLQSREVHLVVLVAPERPQIKNMSQNTQRLVLEENKSKLVVCEMRGGNPAPQIEWLLDNKNISKEAQGGSASNPSSQRITQSKLKMSDIKRTMNGKNLTCIGVHQTLNQSTSVELDVQYVPTVSVVQREYSIVEGSPLSINCQVDANPPPNLVNWRLVSDGSTLASRSQQQASAISLPTRPGPVLEFERISRDLNQNIFECLAQNAYGISLPADVKLNVLYAPFLLNTSHSESVVVGSQAQLACIFDGNPEPEVKWHYTDPLSRSAAAVQLDNNKQQYLSIKNVTYRNEGDYHCEARNQINGVYYGVRSSNILLDVYGEPQFLVKSPVHSKAVQGSKSELALTFCSDPPPSKVYWQFGSIRLDVRLSTTTNGQQSVSALQALSGGPKPNPVAQRFQVHPLQPLQKRDSTFSKVPTCFEATLTLLDPELTDQRDYTLVVHNERGHQSALVRLRVSSPLSPVLMISSAFVTICGLFLFSLLVMFLVKKRQESSAASRSNQNGTNPLNGSSKSVEHLKNGNPNAAALAAAAVAANGQLMQQTRGVVNGVGNGLANGASNPAANPSLSDSVNEAKLHMLSMASSDTSGDQKQLLTNLSSERNSSASGLSSQHCADFASHLNHRSSSSSHSTGNSTPVPLNHISVEPDELQDGGLGDELAPGYQAAGSMLSESDMSSAQQLNASNALIYANLDYTEHQAHLSLPMSDASLHQEQRTQKSPSTHLAQQVSVQRRQATPMEQQSPNLDSSLASVDHQQQQQPQPRNLSSPNQGTMRSSVGATIAMMNSLAAAATQTTCPPGTGVLNGAINQQLANNRQVRKPGPPKPPKPSIQQRSRFYQQQQQQLQHQANNNGLVMIGSPDSSANYHQTESTANDLAVEYSRIAFPARAEL